MNDSPSPATKPIDLSEHTVAFNLKNAYVFAKTQQAGPRIESDAFVYTNKMMAAFYENTRHSKEPAATRGEVWQSATEVSLLDTKAFLKNLEKFQDPGRLGLAIDNRLRALTAWGKESGLVYLADAYLVSPGEEPGEERLGAECNTLQEALEAAGVTGPIDPEEFSDHGIEKYRKWRTVDGPYVPQEKMEDYLVKQWAKANGFDGVWTGAACGTLFSESAQKLQWSPVSSAPTVNIPRPDLDGSPTKELGGLLENRRDNGPGTDFMKWMQKESKGLKPS